MNNTNISEEKKQKAVDQVLCENRFKTFVARDFGISEDELEKWIQENNSANSGAAGKKQGYMRHSFSQKKEEKNADKEDKAEDKEPWPEPPPEKPFYHVRLFNGKFEDPGSGFEFTKPCKVSIQAEFPAECRHYRVEFRLFSIYRGKSEDLLHKKEGFIKDGRAEAELKLFYNNEYFNDKKKTRQSKVEYYFTAHQRDLKKPVESEHLIMPPDVKIKVDLVEAPDVLFNLNSAVPCLDTEGLLMGALLTTLKYASENPEKEVVIFGHTDTSGEHALNYDISELRAKAVKALLDGDAGVFSSVAKEKSQVIDYQTILKTLSTNYGWSCDPGTPDNSNGPKTQTGVKNFQAEYNQKFSGNLAVDGVMGPKTWVAIGEVVVGLVREAYGKALPKLKYGYGGKGLYPCGESFPIEGQGKDNYVSKTNRRVEAVFWDKGKYPDFTNHVNNAELVTKQENPVYDNKRTTRTVIEYKPAESKALQIKTIYGPAALAHNENAVYSVKTFSREAIADEKKSVCWVVKVDGAEIERHDKIGDRFEFTAIGKYAGEKITVHPFLRSPSDNLCVTTTIGQCLVFDGDELNWLNEAHKEVKKWRAWSGEKGKSDPAKDGGPIPAGRWVMLQSQRQQTPGETWWQQVTNKKMLEEFGSDRIELVPFKATETHGRKGPFFIHGGKVAGTAHGIDLVDKMKEFVGEFVKSGKNLVLVVDYGTALVDESGFLVTSAQLEAIYGAAYKASIAKFIKPLNDTMRKYEINTPLRITHFIAQIGHESMRFKYTEEVATGENYEGRADLGNTQPGDGKRFKGRGLIQLTGRSNYAEYGKQNGKDYTAGSNPTLISSDQTLACDVAGWFWRNKSLNNHADKDDVTKITKVINGGLNGFDDRKKLLESAKKVLNIKD